MESALRVRVLEEFSPRYCSNLSGLDRGFDPDRTYRVWKIESYSESGNGFVVLVNDAQEIWWVDNRHVRAVVEEEARIPASAVTSYPYLG